MTRRLVRSALAACFIFAGGSSVTLGADIVPLDGKPVKGTITGVDAQFVSYKDEAGNAAKVPVKDLAAVDLGGKVAAASGTYDEVELTDGSLFRVAEFKTTGKSVQLKQAVSPDGAGAITTTVPLTTVFYWVRRANDGNARAEWRREVIAKRGKRDMLVVRDKDVLQPIEGTVLEGLADGTGVIFERASDSTKQNFPFTRISGGLLFNQPPPAVIPPTACKVLDVYGNVLFAQAVELAGQVVKVKTVSGATVEYASATAVSKLDFSQGNVKYLADLEPTVDAPPPVEGDPYQPYLNNKTPTGPGFRLGGKMYPKGVWVAAETALTYKLDGDYREFKAVFGVDETVQVANATVKVVVEADGRALLTQTITRKADKPVAVNLNVKDVKVLKISVDRETLYSGASLNMADARLQK
jgi:hypothetical protein